MPTVDVFNLKRDKVGSVTLRDDVFAVEVAKHLLHEVVTAQLASKRAGTSAAKERAAVRGSSHKIYKQKGTGRARHGSIRAPIFVRGGSRTLYKQKGTGRARQGSTRAPQFAGGGVVHGPKPRDYDQRTPKKMKAAALRGALSDRARNDRIHVVESLISADAPSTKAAITALASLSERSNFLVVLERTDSVTWLSLRNAPQVHIVAVDQLNTYDVLASDDVVFTQGAYDALVNGTSQVTSVSETEEAAK